MSLWLVVAPAKGENVGGGPVATNAHTCIPAAQRLALQTGFSKDTAAIGATMPQPYRFQPIAGNLWQDRMILNFFDVDPSSGLRDWDCGQWTYDGHPATDILIRGFGEQDIGVPVFAALDGVVAEAHDGEEDRNTRLGPTSANFVILSHGGAHFSWYWHLRKGSVTVRVGQHVRAGEQIGQVGSSGYSETPHIHFESRFDGYAYETYSGRCHPGPQHWVNPPAIPRRTLISEFAVHSNSNIAQDSFYPHNPPRTGTFVRTGAPQTVGAWYVIHNEAPNTTWRARYLRPNGTIAHDSGTRTRNNSYNRMAAWWFSFAFDLDSPGLWRLELSINGQVVADAPFLVLDAGSIPTNRPPERPVAIAFDPPTPTLQDALFCRLTIPSVADADYDLVGYEFHWLINGTTFRKATNAAFADAIPRGVAGPGVSVRCVVTPYDGRQHGPSIEAFTGPEPRPSLEIKHLGANRVVLSWPTSALNYILQANGQYLAAGAWTTATGIPARLGYRMYLTNHISGTSSIYRLKSP